MSDIEYIRWVFDPNAPEWSQLVLLFDAHGIELRGHEADVDVSRYLQLQKEGRLISIIAKSNDKIIGYSNHFWHRDLHFNIRVAQDDAWYVMPEFRKQGVGRRLREMALEELKKDNVKYAYGRLKVVHPHDTSMYELGYVPWETVFIREL